MLAIMALVTWFLAAYFGLKLLLIWLRGGGRQPGRSHVRPSVIFGHTAAAVAGLGLLVSFLLADRSTRLAWTAFAVTTTASLLGAAMYLPWWLRRRRGLKARAARAAELVAAGGAPLPDRARPEPGATADVLPVERRYPNRVVLTHGFLADLTLALILLTALGVGS